MAVRTFTADSPRSLMDTAVPYLTFSATASTWFLTQFRRIWKTSRRGSSVLSRSRARGASAPCLMCRPLLSGVAAYDSYGIGGMFAPKGTPESIIAKMQHAASQVAQEPALRRQWIGEG